MIAPTVADEKDPSNTNVAQVETCEATVGERKSGDAAITQGATAVKQATKVSTI
jgi:hypothetical protein